MLHYGTVEGFKAYHAARGRNVDQFDDDEETAAAMLVASEWIDGRFRTMFPGTKVGMRDQVREWPRVGGTDLNGYVIPSNAVPFEVEAATYEATLRQIIAPGSLSVDWTPPKFKRVSVDGAVSVEYASFAFASDTQTRFALVDEILAMVLTRHSGSSILSGAVNRI